MKATLIEIIRLGLAIEHDAERIYRILAMAAPDDRQRHFWEKMRGQETIHVEYWRKLLAMFQADALPIPFDNPEQVLRDLETIHRKVADLGGQEIAGMTPSSRFLLAYRLEFYLLNPALATLFHILKQASSEQSPLDLYEDHLNSFIEALNGFGQHSPELELLGDTIHRLWEESKRLTRESHMDPLTGIFNRRGLMRTIMPLAYLARRKEYPVGVIMADVDNFKGINDQLGHQRGDAVLEGVTRALVESLRKSDVIGRYGGEEFLVFLSPTDPGQMAAIAEKLRAGVGEARPGGLEVTCSFGCVADHVGRNVEESLRDLIARADAALLQAKQSGKNRVVAA
jgi:diguanylate cyclase (GGDEF)-like protein